MKPKITGLIFGCVALPVLGFLPCTTEAETAYLTEWTQRIQPVGSRSYDVDVDPMGSIYISGVVGGPLGSNTHYGLDDAFLAKYDVSGNMLWSRQTGTISTDRGRSIAADPSGNTFVCGETYGSFDGYVNAGDADVFLTKYDTAGNQLWTQQIGTPEYDLGLSVATDAQGNAFVSGFTKGELYGYPSFGGYDTFLTKFDPSGNKVWSTMLGTTSSTASDFCYSVATDQAGNAYITGKTSGSIDPQTHAVGWDLFLVKISHTGSKLWRKQLNGNSSHDSSRSVATDNQGNIYISGYSDQEFDGNTHAGGDDAILVKFDTSGNILWSRQLGTAEDERGYAVATDASGNVYMSGWTNGEIDNHDSAGLVDTFLAKYDPQGDLLWTQQVGTDIVDWVFSLAPDALGNVYITGWTEGSLDGGPAGNYAFLTKLSPPIPGDLNGDGFVGLDDLNIVLNNWNHTALPGSYLAADPSGDGYVGLDDLDIILNNWNTGTPPAPANIPEPASLALLGLGAVAILRRR